MLNNLIKNVAIWLVIALVLMTVFNQFSNRQTAQSIIPYSQFMEEVKQARVKSALVEGRTVRWQSIDDRKYITYSPGTLGDLWMVSDLLKYGVKVDAKPEEEQSFLMQIFISWFPMLLLIGIWIFFMRCGFSCTGTPGKDWKLSVLPPMIQSCWPRPRR